MPKAPPNNFAAITIVAGVLIVVLAVASPSMLGLVFPVALVLLAIHAKNKQRQRVAAQGTPPAVQGTRPTQPAPSSQQAPDPSPWSQPVQPVQPAQSHQAPPPPWWTTESFPTSQPRQPPVPAAPPPLPEPPRDPENRTVPPEVHTRVAELRRSGRTVEAIDVLREELGWELYPASQYVLAIEAP